MSTILDDRLLESGEDFMQYRLFLHEEEVFDFGAFLDSHNIRFRTGKLNSVGEKLLVGEVSILPYYIEVRTSDFAAVDQLLADEAAIFVDSEDMKHHPLASFTSKELYDVVMKPDEWSPEYVKIAKILLERQGVIPENSPTPQRSLPEKSSTKWMWLILLFVVLYMFIKKYIAGEILQL